MEHENAIRVLNLKKKFKVYHDKGNMLKEKVLHWSRNRYEERWVIKDISFNVKKGEAIGLIGENGCGKSTMLKMLTRIMYPDSGTIEMKGRVSSLLELGAGFHPDLSGRENIYINASIFGLNKKEIDKRINEIISFSELEDYIDNPVRTYSSGMYMRLAFSVAINVNAEILLIDEILAVGDVNFQNKCFNKMQEIKRKGTTIILVSHSTDQIESICDRSIWIHDGYIKADGPCRDVHKQYLKFMGKQRHDYKNEEQTSEFLDNDSSEAPLSDSQTESTDTPIVNSLHNSGDSIRYKERGRGNGYAKIVFINSYDQNGKAKSVFESGDTAIFKIKYEVYHPASDILFGFSIFRNDGTRCYGTNTKIDDIQISKIEKNGEFIITFPRLELLEGKYYVDVCIATREDDMLDYLDTVNDFEVYNTSGEMGICKIPLEWKINL